jgi:hypothetical protein
MMNIDLLKKTQNNNQNHFKNNTATSITASQQIAPKNIKKITFFIFDNPCQYCFISMQISDSYCNLFFNQHCYNLLDDFAATLKHMVLGHFNDGAHYCLLAMKRSK